MPEASQVTVIIPNYNGKELLEKCIKTLERQSCRDFKLLIVDNGSTDGSTGLRSEVLDLQMILLKENKGFCGAVNIGLQNTKTPYVILLNNDTEAEEHFVEELLRGICGSKYIFSCGAQMIDYRKRDLLDNAGDLYTILGWAVARGKGKPAVRFERETEVFSCCGGAVIYRMDLIRKIGMLDERHFAYLEDVDLGYRSKIYGYRNRYIPQAKVYHVGSATTGTRYNEKKVYLAARNSIFLIYKNMPLLQFVLNLPFLAIGILLKWLFFIRKKFHREYIQGVCDGIRECRKCRKVSFKMKHLKNYIRIEFELIGNVFRILFLL